jgi:predicted GIY-YIG superfamily endonuclease
MIGIYAIRNKVNNKVYIGSSVDIFRRFRKHKTELNTGKHSNIHLKRAFEIFGKDVFEFIFLEECEKEVLIQKEIEYIQKYNSLNEECGYNMCVPRVHPSVSCSETYSTLLSDAKKGITPSNFNSMQQTRWKKVEVYKEKILIATYINCYEAERALGIKRGNIYNYLKGKTKSLRNFKNYEFKEKI